MKFYLIAENGPKMGLPISVDVDLFLMGSDKSCQLRAKHLGSRQCALVTREDRVFIRDFDSGEPTLVNGQGMPAGAEWPLRDGDHLEVGRLQFLIHFGSQAPARSLEEWEASCFEMDGGRFEDEHDVRPAGSAADAAARIIGKLNAMTGQLAGRLRISQEAGVTTVRFNDSSLVDDAEVDQIRNELASNLARPRMRILLDLKNVERLSTKAVTMIADFHRSLHPVGSSMALCRVPADLRRIMQSMPGTQLRIFADPASALTSRW